MTVCRVCLQTGELLDIYKEVPTTRANLTISEKLVDLSKIQIFPEDGLPSTICKKCCKKIDICLNFIQLIKHSDHKLRCALKYVVKQEEKELVVKNEAVCESYKADDIIVCQQKTVKRIRENIKQQCPVCGRIMSSSHRLKTHLRTHSGERPYTCQYCSNTFTLQSSLKLHLLTHTGEKPLKCPQCDATFRQRSALIAHVRKHTGQKPYCCQLCPQQFATFGNLQYHIRKHTGEKNYECDTCGRAFITRGQLTQHLACHSGDRPHTCTVCGKQLTRASNLRRHMIVMHESAKHAKVKQNGDSKSRTKNRDRISTQNEVHVITHNITK